MKDLRGLDERLVPLAAARVARWRSGLAALSHRLSARSRRRGELRAPGVRGLRQLDERYATSGPLALFREVPQLGFVVIGLVFLAGAGTAVSREAAHNRQTQQVSDPLPGSSGALPGAEGEVSSTLGPAVGDAVQAYLRKAATTVAQAASEGGDRVALVSFRSYLTPGQVKGLLGGYSVQRVYLRSRPGGKDAAQLPVNVTGDLGKALKKAYADAARGRAVAHKAYQMYVNTLTVVSKEDQAFKDLYAAFAASTEREARDYSSSCPCVYAAVVLGSPRSLAALAKKAGARAVEAASKGQSLSGLEVLPLLPEVRGVVPVAQAPVDPP